MVVGGCHNKVIVASLLLSGAWVFWLIVVVVFFLISCIIVISLLVVLAVTFPSGQMKNWLSATNIHLVWVFLCNFWLCSALESSRVLLLVGKTAQSSDLSRTVRSTLRLTWSNRLQTNPNLECRSLAKMTSRKWERKKVCLPHLFLPPEYHFPLTRPVRWSPLREEVWAAGAGVPVGWRRWRGWRGGPG